MPVFGRFSLFCLLAVHLAYSVQGAEKTADNNTQHPKQAEPSWPKYQLLRYQEDYLGLYGQQPRDWLDGLKDIPLGEDLRLSIGGQARLRFENKHNEVFGSGTPRSDKYFLDRYRLHGDLHYQDWLRVFVEGKFAHAYQRERPAPLIFQDKADLENAFVDITPWPADNNKIVFRLGRQELLYGKQRLVSSFDWANVMRTFDGARILLTVPEDNGQVWQIDGWWTRLVQIDNDGWNDTDENTQFFGVYASHKRTSVSGYDIYALGFSGDERTSANGNVGTDTRMTFGGRFWYTQYEPWDFEVEAAWQTGRFTGDRTNAWMVALESGYTCKDLRAAPRVALGYEFASGDSSSTSSAVGTFNQLFPLGHAYLGYIDVVGRQNIHSLYARADFKPIQKLKAWAQVYNFWTAAGKDSLYNAGGVAIRRDLTGGSGNYVGMEMDLAVEYQLDHHSAFLAGYSHFWPGSFIQSTGPDEPIDFFYLQYQFTF